MGSAFFMSRNSIGPYVNGPKLTRCHIIVHISIHVVATWAAMSDAMSAATLAATSGAMSISMSLIVEHVELSMTIFVTFIFVIDIGLGLG